MPRGGSSSGGVQAVAVQAVGSSSGGSSSGVSFESKVDALPNPPPSQTFLNFTNGGSHNGASFSTGARSVD